MSLIQPWSNIISRPAGFPPPKRSPVARWVPGWQAALKGDSRARSCCRVPNPVAKMFEEASEVFDNMFKSSFPLTFIVFIPAVLILVSPLPAEAAHEFTVYRMQQYDLQGQPYGEAAPFSPLFLPAWGRSCPRQASAVHPKTLSRVSAALAGCSLAWLSVSRLAR